MNATETVATEPKPTGKPKGARMERFNIVLPVDDSEWLDRCCRRVCIRRP